MIKWQDRNVHIAIGLGLVLLAIKWGFNGDFQFTKETLAGTATVDVIDNEGVVTSEPVPRDAGVKNQVLDLIWGAIAIIGMILARIGSLVIALVTYLINRFDQPQPQVASSMPDPVNPAKAVPEPQSSEDAQREAVLELARAAKRNDQEMVRQWSIALRRPDALTELQKAYVTGDRIAISALTAELDSYLKQG